MFFFCRKRKEANHIFVKDMTVDASIGVFDEEKAKKQKVIISIIAETSIWPDATRDNIKDAVSYAVLVEHVLKNTQGKHIHLVETLAENIARDCLAERYVEKVTVRVEKPDIFPFAVVGAEIVRVKAR